ncbi:MAG: hypothetical protein SNJ71_00310 [Bacteroidales bacterium]
MITLSITIPGDTNDAQTLAAYINEAVQYVDSQTLSRLFIVMRGKDGKSHDKNIKKALKYSNLL